MRYILTLSYNGAPFCGWQIQPNDPSVQGLLEKVLTTLLGCPAEVTGAGRTDTGVNAIGYVAHFDSPVELDTEQFRYKLNAILPPSVVISDISETSSDFHARFDAKRREYSYFLHRKKDPFIGSFSLQCGYELDFKLMNEAAALLIGRHDFSCFEKTGADNKTSVCTVFESQWKQYVPTHAQIMRFQGEYWYFRISADRFLRNMVRAIVGTLIEVGRGKRSISDFEALIMPPDAMPDGEVGNVRTGRRSRAGESVPGYALFLSDVEYQQF